VGENLITHKDYADTLGEKSKEIDIIAMNQTRNLFGEDIPNELILSTKRDSVGLAILKAMKQGGGTNKNRVIGAAPPEKKPDFDQMVKKN